MQPSQADPAPRAKEPPLTHAARPSFTCLGRGGRGPPRRIVALGKSHDYHDGAGLTSPGRWDPAHRLFPAWERLRGELEGISLSGLGGEEGLQAACLRMAAGRAEEEHGSPLFPPETLASIRAHLAKALAAGTSAPVDDLLAVAPNQPFFLKFLAGTLAAAGDRDHEFLSDCATGVSAGILSELPRTPEIFEPQTRWRFEENFGLERVEYSPNYNSAEENSAWLEAHFEEEVAEGRMIRLRWPQLRAEYPVHAVAAVAVLVNDFTGKKRAVHDATHHVRVNHKIRVRDRLRMPGPREKRYLLAKYRDARAVPFAVLGDVEKAHRRVKVVREEWGLLACQARTGEHHPVYLNTCMPFGVASAAIWWARVGGALVRAVYALLGPRNELDMLLFADDLEVVGDRVQGRRSIVLAFLYFTAFGVPFKLSKTHGGLAVDWIGLHVCYPRYELGISAKRRGFLLEWTEKTLEAGWVTPRAMAAALGRWGFAATALTWERPFLGPLYGWVAAILRGDPPGSTYHGQSGSSSAGWYAGFGKAADWRCPPWRAGPSASSS